MLVYGNLDKDIQTHSFNPTFNVVGLEITHRVQTFTVDMFLVLVYGDFGENTQHIGCFNPACDVVAIAKGMLHLGAFN